MKVAIMQPCYLPWRGYFALMKLSDCFIHLDDVPLPQGRSFQTRVQVRTANGSHWLTVPVTRVANQLIRDVEIADDSWRPKHLRTLQQEVSASADIVSDLYSRPWSRLVDLNIALVDQMADALDLPTQHLRSSALNAPDHGWRKLLRLCRAVGADTYITGHGARNYFDHEAFERAGVDVLYVDYDLSPYPQRHKSAFDPYVTALDILAHAPDPSAHIGGSLVPWREFLNRHPSNTPQQPISASAIV